MLFDRPIKAGSNVSSQFSPVQFFTSIFSKHDRHLPSFIISSGKKMSTVVESGFIRHLVSVLTYINKNNVSMVSSKKSSYNCIFNKMIYTNLLK